MTNDIRNSEEYKSMETAYANAQAEVNKVKAAIEKLEAGMREKIQQNSINCDVVSAYASAMTMCFNELSRANEICTRCYNNLKNYAM